MTHVIRCNNLDIHDNPGKEPGEGNILCFVEKSRIYIQCSDHRCSRWSEIEITIPGINIDLTQVGIVHRLMPPYHRFDARKATVILETK